MSNRIYGMRCNQNWLTRCARLIGHYRYYRKQNYRPLIAWRLARNTL